MSVFLFRFFDFWHKNRTSVFVCSINDYMFVIKCKYCKHKPLPRGLHKLRVKRKVVIQSCQHLSVISLTRIATIFKKTCRGSYHLFANNGNMSCNNNSSRAPGLQKKQLVHQRDVKHHQTQRRRETKTLKIR